MEMFRRLTFRHPLNAHEFRTCFDDAGFIRKECIEFLPECFQRWLFMIHIIRPDSREYQ